MNLNIVSRIAIEKDFFESYIRVISEMKRKHSINWKLNFIGEIQSQEIYNKILNLCEQASVSELISFTKRSIPFNELLNGVDDYYIHRANARFIGYSAVESIKFGFKTILMNIEGSTLKFEERSFCSNEEELFQLLYDLSVEKAKTDQIIIEENEILLKQFYLSDAEKDLLENILKGNF